MGSQGFYERGVQDYIEGTYICVYIHIRPQETLTETLLNTQGGTQII